MEGGPGVRSRAQRVAKLLTWGRSPQRVLEPRRGEEGTPVCVCVRARGMGRRQRETGYI